MKTKFMETQFTRLCAGSIDRRQFMMSTLAAGLALPQALSLTEKADAMIPKSGGTFRHGSSDGTEKDNYDVFEFTSNFQVQLPHMYMSNLVEIDANGDLHGDLAESFETDDGKKWLFKIRKGVEFHNGKPLTTKDIVTSLHRHMGEDSKSIIKSIFANVDSITHTTDEIIIDLKKPYALFPYVLSGYESTIYPEKDGKADVHAGIGTGGYIVESFEPGRHFIATKNPNYHKQNRGHFDAIERLAYADDKELYRAMVLGKLDLISPIDPKVVDFIKSAPNTKIVETAGLRHYTFPMRVDQKPFNNPDLRKALKYAINRQEIVDKLLLGYGRVGNDHPISESMASFASDITQRGYDPELAAKYYKKSGHSGTLNLSVAEAAFIGATDVGYMIAKSAKEAGIDVKVVKEKEATYWSEVWMKKPWCASSWLGRPTADWMLSLGYSTESSWNETGWADTRSAKKFNKILKDARVELNDEERKGKYHEAQKLLHDDGGAIIPVFASNLHAVSSKVVLSEKLATNYENDGFKAHERWWFN